MGVSGLLRDILKKYPSVHLPAPHPNIKIDYLFIDFNAFIYNTIHAFPKDVVYDFSKNKETTSYEKQLVKLVIKNTLELVNKVCKPSKLLYIAIDGPPPLAKMVQQRERRYMNVYKEQLNKQYDPTKYITGASFDKNRITPGTSLMSLLNKEFTKIVKAGKFGKIAVVFDGSNVPGEAEHKYLKIIEEIDAAPNDKFVIISGDGDAILLSLRFPNKSVYIMQSVANSIALEDLYPLEQQYAYLDIKRFIDSLYDFYDGPQIGGKMLLSNEEKKLVAQFKQKTAPINSNQSHKKKKDFLIDYVFMSFMEGNDFAKPIFFLKYKEDHMRTPLSIYRFQRKFNPNFRLISFRNEQAYINQQNFAAIINRLAKIEEEKIAEVKQRLEKKISHPPAPAPFKKGLTPKQLDPINKEDSSLEHKMFTDQDHILHAEYVKQYDFLFNYKDFQEFKKKYYEYFWNEPPTPENIAAICKNYLDILLFNIRYYYGTGLSWSLNYHAVAAPLPSDLANFLQKNPKYYDNLQLEEGEPVHPLVLLAYVMPPQSMKEGILPKAYRDALLKKYPEYFPEEIELKLLVPGCKLIYAEPILPSPPISILKEVLETIKLTKLEKERNKLDSEPIVYSPK
jgi:5'-3' exonuclease